ncbi:MAG TPA: hypothetical protein VHW01_01690 [Polyangiaceae bacterium]|jgi:hypothetical protein|nr:hypothetical protein [Polyangiaceae bacterium]
MPFDDDCRPPPRATTETDEPAAVRLVGAERPETLAALDRTESGTR